MTDRERENCRCRQFWQARQGGLCGGPGGKGKKIFFLLDIIHRVF